MTGRPFHLTWQLLPSRCYLLRVGGWGGADSSLRAPVLRIPNVFFFFSLHATTFNCFHFALRVFTTLLWFKLPLQTAPCPPETNYLTGLREVSGCQADCSILTVFHVSSGMRTWFVCFPCVPPCLSVHAWCVRARVNVIFIVEIAVSCPISDEQIFPRDLLHSSLNPPQKTQNSPRRDRCST